MITSLETPMSTSPPAARTTHRRLKLAEWITDPRHPLTARVYVNRLWQHHFGRGLVSSTNNFGFNGQKPSHPELLDYLAGELVSGGWSSKRLHYLMMTSRAYQQSSIHPAQESYASKDPDNQLLWRAARRRLDAEGIRDAILTAAGQVDERIGGPSLRRWSARKRLEGAFARRGVTSCRRRVESNVARSLYMYSRRGLLSPLLTTFDFCDTTQPCGQRDVSVVAPQALALLNGAFAHEQSQAIARRAVSLGGQEPRARVRAAWRVVLGRAPSETELDAAVGHLKRQRDQFQEDSRADELALASLCHVLINSNEFIFVD